MFSRVFSYAVNSTATLIKRFTITANIITFYQGQPESANRPGPYEFGALAQLKQANPKCAGERYPFVRLDDREHTIVNPHVSRLEMKENHNHLSFCEVPTPADLDSLLKQLMELQSNKVLMKQYNYDNNKLLQLAKMLSKGKRNEITLPNNPIPGEFVTQADAAELLKQYRAHYDLNVEEIKKQHAANQEQLHARGTVADLGIIALKTALISSVFAVARESMLVNGVDRRYADWIVDSLVLIFLAAYTQDVKPVLATYIMNKTIERMPDFKHSRIIKNALLLGIYVICSDSPRSWYSALQVSVSAVTSYATNMGVQAFSYCFFNSETVESDVANNARPAMRAERRAQINNVF